jgi:ribosome maturation factor RimP
MPKIDALKADVVHLAQPLCDASGLELVDVKVNPYQGVLHVQVLADLPQGGIGMEACAELNRCLAAELDMAPAFGDNYTLEVSSPGLDRPLSGYRDIRRVLGREVQVFLKPGPDPRREWSGELTAVSVEGIIVRTRRGDVEIAMDQIEKVKQIIS